MTEILAIFGALVLALVLVAVAVFFLIRWKVRKFMERLAGMSAGAENPDRIHLKGVAANHWNNRREVQRIETVVRANGYSDAGSFTIPELPDILLMGFVRTKDQSIAVIYEHAKIETPWLDIALRREDKSGFTVSNAPQGGELDHMPGQKKVYLKGASTEEVIRRFDADRPTEGPAVRVNVEDFQHVFEEAYAQEMDWRNARGGPTSGEIERVAEAMGEPAPPEVVQAAKAAMEGPALRQFEQRLIEEFRRVHAPNESHWNDVASGLVIIHDHLSPARVENVFFDHALGNDSGGVIPDVSGLGPREAFGKLDKEVGRGAVFQYLGSVEKPGPADFYVPMKR